MTAEQIIEAARSRNRAKGLNVRFVNDATGKPDEWSFRDLERRDRFIAKLRAEGRDCEVAT